MRCNEEQVRAWLADPSWGSFLHALAADWLEMRAEIDRSTESLREMLRRVDEEQNGIAICSWCAEPTSSDEESRRAHQSQCAKSPIVAERDSLRKRLTRAHEWSLQLACGLRAVGHDYEDAQHVAGCVTCQRLYPLNRAKEGK